MKVINLSVFLLLVGFCASACKVSADSNLISVQKNVDVADSRQISAEPTTSVAESQTDASKKKENKLQDKLLDGRLLTAAQKGNDTEVAKLIKTGANLDAVINFGKKGSRTALIAALNSANSSTANILIDAGADVNLSVDFKDGKYLEKNVTPLMIASKNAPELVEKLIDKGAKVNELSSLGNSALMTGDVKTIKYLLGKGANPNVQNKDGDTPLIFLIGYLKMYSEDEIADGVKTLIEKGAEVNKANKKGETPIQKADYIGSKKIVALLENAGAKK